MVYEGSVGGVTGLSVQQICDESATTVTTSTLVASADGTTYSTSQTSSMACPVFTYNAFVQFVIEFKYIWGPIIIVVGLFLGFLGRKLFNVAVFIVGTIVVSGLILIIFYGTFLKDNT